MSKKASTKKDKSSMKVSAPGSVLAAPMPVPQGDPATFATSHVAMPSWPLLTTNPSGKVVSYQDVNGHIIGNESRRFLAARTSGGAARYHVGIDLYARMGDAVVACGDGVIVDFYGFLESHGETTYALIVAHQDFVVNYGEVREDSLSKLGLQKHDTVRAGQQIGWVGATGMLHFETYAGGTQHNIRWIVGQPRPKALFNPTRYLLELGGADSNLPSLEPNHMESLLMATTGSVKPQRVDTLEERYFHPKKPHNRKRDVPLYKLPDRAGFFHKGSMQIDVDGSPRAYAPNNKPPHPGDPQPLDSQDNADGQGGSSTYIQGKMYGSTLARGPRPGYYVSATSLRYDKKVMWDCDNFVDAESIPYFVHPDGRNGITLGTVGVIVHIPSGKWTSAIHADTNNALRVSEASLAVAVNLGRSKIDPKTLKVTGLSGGNGDDDRNYFYLYFPGVVVAAAALAPHWPAAAITQAANAAFQQWGGMAMVTQCLKDME
jgi:hypothetical protein